MTSRTLLSEGKLDHRIFKTPNNKHPNFARVPLSRSDSVSLIDAGGQPLGMGEQAASLNMTRTS